MNISQLNNGDQGTPRQQPPQQQKPLRFITNLSAPNPKRRRIGAACLTCRKRKTACSGERPHCKTCKQNKLDCAGYSSEASSAHKRTPSDAGVKRSAESSDRQKLGGERRPSPGERGRSNGELPHKTPSGISPAIINAVPTATTDRDRERKDEPLFSGPRNRMPYFRWLGPTAIMPGFKQMVVKVKRQDTNGAQSSTDGGAGMLSPSINNLNTGDQRVSSLHSGTPAGVDLDARTPLSLPFYDNSPMPPSELITHLVDTFFTHLGCNYPFLQRERFLRDLEEKQVDAILVDAVCALAARFSTHSLLTQQPYDENKPTPAEYGHAFAQRAKSALSDTFPCPSVAAVQAALLLAYNEFGESRDSGLWMYLGISIRMAQDLGLHKLEGLKYKGMHGPTPKMVKRESLSENSLQAKPREKDVQESTKAGIDRVDQDDADQQKVDEQKAVEQERIDTFWAVFFLDRVVSSGTGRRSTLRDNEIEISFPSLDEQISTTGWPAAFPALIRIVHLYGRVADLLNSIKEPSDINSETPKRLAAMEKQVTELYQNLSPRLHFDAVNFQHYMKAGEGTNFVLLHFWFHMLIVLLHQPTLLKTFEGKMLQLFPNSQQLSMSSAKTIADILAYSQLMDIKASLGNPFTTQPIYIAACAFLKETAEQTASSSAQSRASSPSRKEASSESTPSTTQGTPQNLQKKASMSAATGAPLSAVEQKALAKHTLLATAASQHYGLCYKALQSLETYWAGTKYILTILNQKFEGVDDPLLYTVEEGESSIEQPRPEPAFTSPGWRRKLSWGPYIGNPSPFFKSSALAQVPGSPSVDPSKAIGWTLTGTMNSPSTNLAWHFSNTAGALGQSQSQAGASATGSLNEHYGQQSASAHSSQQQVHPLDNMSQSNHLTSFPGNASNPAQTNSADLLLGLNSSYPPNSNSHTPGTLNDFQQHTGGNNNFAVQQNHAGTMAPPLAPYFGNGQSHIQNFDNMMIESQDVDMSVLGLDAMPWFGFDAYPAHEMMTMFDPGGGTGATAGAEQTVGDHQSTPQ
jgi:hypothetical protein